MAGNDSFAYCDSDEECFIGKISELELLKRALTGQNSPIPKPVTIEEQSLSISDSILNISHRSSITSPVSQVVNKVTSNLIDNDIYEDISADKEQIFGPTNRSDCIVQSSSLCVENDNDLHMSVDEIDYQQNRTIASSLESETILPQSSELNFYFDKSSVSSYHTANTNNENAKSKQSSDSFKSCRKDVNVSADLDVIDMTSDIDIDDKDKKKTSFEIIVQNRQNSFIPSSPPDGSKKAYKIEQLNIAEENKISRLPVYSHSAKSLIQPPKLNFTSDYMKSNSYKIQTVNLKNTKLNENIQVKRDAKCKLTRPLKLKSQIQEVKEKGTTKPVGTVQCSSNIPSLHKTHLKPVASKPSRLVESEPNTPIPNTLSTEEKNKSIKPSLLKDKNRFNHIVSPVQAYISRSPTVLQKRKDVLEDIKLVVDTRISKKKSNLPMNTETESVARKIMKKLNLEKGQSQENVCPNYSRDTLPPRALEHSEAIFMKKPEPLKAYLPKMGQKMQKLLDTPRPKIIVHQGRVKHSPNMKGVLFPNTIVKRAEDNFHSPTERVSIRVEKTANNSNKLK